jgi:DNA recombination protein Rad52
MLNEQQIKELEGPLSRGAVKERKQGGSNVSYVEGWHVIAEANRIFGFDKWTRETLDVRCVSEKDREIGAGKSPGYGVTYIVKVRVIVDGVAREGCGAGHGIDRDLGQAHESAIKEAETDAMKRAFMTFGNKFGLALYDKTQASVADEVDESYVAFVSATRDMIRSTNDPKRLREWWASEEQKTARRDFQITEADLRDLMSFLKTRLEGLEPKKAAA